MKREQLQASIIGMVAGGAPDVSSDLGRWDMKKLDFSQEYIGGVKSTTYLGTNGVSPFSKCTRLSVGNKTVGMTCQGWSD